MDELKAKLLIQKIDASILMLSQIKGELENLLGVEFHEEPIEQIEETWLGDDGKEYKASTPYKKAKQWYCCGRPLEIGEKNGKQVYCCSVCHSNYSG